MVQQPAAHTFGPHKPSIGFWYGEHFLGEAIADLTHDDPVVDARQKVAHSIDMLEVGHERQTTLARLFSSVCEPKIYC